jgi:type II secretory pathway pseudopilin PulG
MIRNRLPSGSEPTRRRRKNAGFTILEMAISLVISGAVITGAWMSYSSMLRQWRVAFADRMMDQYAHSTMQELTNLISWSWGAVQVQGGPRTPRWKFMMDDVIQENGIMDQWTYHRDPDGFITLTYDASRGILINSSPPKWAADRYRNMYVWSGTRPGDDQVRVMDRRDRMTIEGLQLEFQTFPWFWVGTDSSASRTEKWRAAVKVWLLMQYRSQGEAFHQAPGVFAPTYVREREYQTQIFMRNWDVERNAFKDQVLGRS